MSSVTKRKRVVLSKPSKDGCQTCRERRIKCDQIRPTCHACSVKRRYCHYTEFKPYCATERLIMPLLTSDVEMPSKPTTGLSFGIKMNERDAMSLQHFVIDLLPVFANASPYLSLSRIAFYSCVTEWTVLRAMVAMMHSHNNRAFGFDSTLLAINQHHSSDSVGEQYSRALSALNMQINTTLGRKSSEIPIYIACLFLMCFEQFQGMPGRSQEHLRNMKRILYRRITSRSLISATPQEQYILQELSGSFKTIDLEFAEVSNDNSPLGSLLKELDEIIDAADRFRQDLVDQGRKILATNPPIGASDSVQYCLASCLGRIVCLTGATAYHTRWQKLSNDHKAWNRRFEMLESCSSHRQLWLARIQYFFSSQVLRRLRPGLLIDDPDFEENCKIVLRLAEQYLLTFNSTNDSNTPARTDEEPTLSVVYNVIRALYFISLRSECKETRAAAITILYTAKRKESTVSSLYLAEFAGVVDMIVQDEIHQKGESCMPYEVINAHERGVHQICHMLFVRLLFDDSQQPKSVQLREYRRTFGTDDTTVDALVSTSWFLSSEQMVSLSPYL